MVLLGQPELGAAHQASFRRSPSGSSCATTWAPWTADEVSAYIQHRSRVAGATRRLFSSRAEVAAHAETGGIPRLVNLLCANALFVGFVRGESQVGEDLIRDLSEDRDIEREAGGAE